MAERNFFQQKKEIFCIDIYFCLMRYIIVTQVVTKKLSHDGQNININHLHIVML